MCTGLKTDSISNDSKKLRDGYLEGNGKDFDLLMCALPTPLGNTLRRAGAQVLGLFGLSSRLKDATRYTINPASRLRPSCRQFLPVRL